LKGEILSTPKGLTRQARRYEPYASDLYWELNQVLTAHLNRYDEELRGAKVLDFGCGERPFELGLRHGQLTHRGGSDALLAELNSEAKVLVYPSLYEGFGIPTIEATPVGGPVITSKTGSLPKVVGNAGEYFDSNDQAAIMQALGRVVCSPTRCAELIALGLQHYCQFTREKCYRETHEICRNLL